MKKLLTTSIAVVALLFVTNVALAQSATSTSVLTLSIPAFVQLDDANLPVDIATLGNGLDPASNDIDGDIQSHDVEVLTNSASGADLTLAINATGAPGLATDAWDDVSIEVSDGGLATGTTAATGSSAGTFNPRTCAADCSAFLVTDMIGGNFTYTVDFQVTLDSQFALEGTRTFDAVYTVSL